MASFEPEHIVMPETLKEGGVHFGVNPSAAAEVTAAVRAVTGKTVIVKLTPNVTDITRIALAVEEAGADAVSLIDALSAMPVDAHSRKPVLGNVFGGLSGLRRAHHRGARNGVPCSQGAGHSRGGPGAGS
ncbi:MAG: hypothetical protein U5N86_14110 [Planctomycetota bacterium]|nr:hypothetical protein [Planctomycetota bacterium]